jgi:hypothetical protein
MLFDINKKCNFAAIKNMNDTIDKRTGYKVSFMTFIILRFAQADKMNVQEAYLY